MRSHVQKKTIASFKQNSILFSEIIYVGLRLARTQKKWSGHQVLEPRNVGRQQMRLTNELVEIAGKDWVRKEKKRVHKMRPILSI